VQDRFDLTDLRESDATTLKINMIVLWYLKRLYRVLLRLESGKTSLLAKNWLRQFERSRPTSRLPEEPGECVVKVPVRVLK
jgi:hypothetical protein